MTTELPTLTGSPKQIAWASELRPALAERVRATRIAAQTAFDRKIMIAEKKGRPFFEPNGFRNDHGWTREQADICIRTLVDICDEMLRNPDAGDWIDQHRSFGLVVKAKMQLESAGKITPLQGDEFARWVHDRLSDLTA